MSTVVGLPVSGIIAVAIVLTPTGVATPNFNTALVLGTSTVIDVVTRMRTYGNLAGVAADFGTAAEEYLAAQAWFAQIPAPTSLCVGRWAKLAAAGQLIGGGLSAANQLIGAWSSIANGSFAANVNAAGSTNITGLNFTGQTNLNGVAAVIQTALRAVATGGYTTCTFVYDAVNQRFVFTSGTTGISSTVAFLAAGGGGTDISAQLAMRSTSSGAYVANGLGAESCLTAVTILDQLYSSQWYGLFVPSNSDSDIQAVAPYIEGAAITLHYYVYNQQEAGTLVSSDTSNISYLLKQTGYNHTAGQYSSTSLYAAFSMLARILTTQWNQQNTDITLMYKTEPGIVAETLNTTQAAAVAGFNCNVYVNYNNGAGIIQFGVASSGQFVDSVIGCDWLASNVQTALFNALFTTPTKIPQTDAGMHVLAVAIAGVCQQGVNNGLLAPGTWNAPGFGQLKQGDFVAQGFYIYQPPVSSQSASDRAARKSVPFQVAAKLGGAVHTVNCTINVNP